MYIYNMYNAADVFKRGGCATICLCGPRVKINTFAQEEVTARARGLDSRSLVEH